MTTIDPSIAPIRRAALIDENGDPINGANPLVVSAVQAAPLGYEQITDLSSAATLTVPTGATSAVVTVETKAVRYRDDGTAPTSTVGMPLAAGQSAVISGADVLAAVEFIEQSASAALSVSYY